jgi:hypothetical protein
VENNVRDFRHRDNRAVQTLFAGEQAAGNGSQSIEKNSRLNDEPAAYPKRKSDDRFPNHRRAGNRNELLPALEQNKKPPRGEA